MRRIHITTALLLGGLAACEDLPVNPAAVAAGPEFTTGERAARIPNSVKYSDTGARPTSGQMGAASLAVYALLDKAGTTELEVISGRAGQPGVEAGQLDNVQVKVFPGGTADDPVVENFHRVAAARLIYEYAGLGRGVPLQVKATVSGIEPNRTDVVTVQDQVWLRPDLAVVSLELPFETRVGTATPVQAVVRERNGDVGARADCVLYVNEVEVDRAAGIWVDAGGTVSCAFVHTFAVNGVQFVRVAVEGVDPGDYDAANNSLRRGISVVPPEAFYGGASAEDYQWDDLAFDSTTYDYSDGRRYQYVQRNATTGRDQQMYVIASINRSLTFPVDRLLIRHTSGGAVTYELDMANVQPNENGCLFTEYAAGGLGWLELCPFGFGASFTRLVWLRSAGDAVYHSYNYTALWNADGSPVYEQTYVSTTPQTESRTPEAWAGSVRVDVLVQDDGATYHSAANVVLQPDSTVVDYGGGCDSADVGWAIISQCWESRLSRIGVVGGAPLQAVF